MLCCCCQISTPRSQTSYHEHAYWIVLEPLDVSAATTNKLILWLFESIVWIKRLQNKSTVLERSAGESQHRIGYCNMTAWRWLCSLQAILLWTCCETHTPLIAINHWRCRLSQRIHFLLSITVTTMTHHLRPVSSCKDVQRLFHKTLEYISFTVPVVT